MRGRTRLGWTIGILATACGPDLAPLPAGTESTSGSTTAEPIGSSTTSLTSVDTTATTDSGSEGSSSTGGPEPLPCINIEPADGDVCYVEHLLEPSVTELTLSDQDGDGWLDVVFGESCCDDVEPATSGIGLMRGNPEGTFGEPQLIAEVEGSLTWMLPIGPGPDGVSRVVTTRAVDVGFLVVTEYGMVVGESFVPGIPGLPDFQEENAEAADVDGDGVLDFLAIVESTSALFVGFVGPDGAFDFIPYDLDLNALVTLLCGDENGDGLDDLLLMRKSFPGEGITYLGAWSHTQPGVDFEAVPLPDSWSMLVGRNLRDPRLIDVDGDGILDVFSRDSQSRLVVARGIEGGFEEQVESDLGEAVLSMEPTDLDQDGLVDAVVRREGADDELWLMRLTGSLGFEGLMRLGLTHTPIHYGNDWKLVVADLNADGHDDFVTVVYDPEHEWRVVAVVSHPEQPV